MKSKQKYPDGFYRYSWDYRVERIFYMKKYTVYSYYNNKWNIASSVNTVIAPKRRNLVSDAMVPLKVKLLKLRGIPLNVSK